MAGTPDMRFYHSFPRTPSFGSSPDLHIRKGLRTLESILSSGLLLVPELLAFPSEASLDGTKGAPVFALQRRFSLTLLHPFELREHAKLFGSFAIALDIHSARRIGAIPVVYIPQPLDDRAQPLLDRLAQTLVYRLIEVEYLLADLDCLARFSEQPEGERFELAAGDRVVRLPVSFVRDIVELLSYRKQSFSELRGAIRCLSTFFYPTDSIRNVRLADAKSLFYYGQREWRVTSDTILVGEEVDRPVTPAELDALLEIDKEFFGERVEFGEIPMPRAEACRVLDFVAGIHVRDLIETILVPAPVLDEAKRIARRFGAEAKVLEAQDSGLGDWSEPSMDSAG